MKKRLLLFAFVTLIAISLSSCFGLSDFATGFADGYDSGSRGYSYIGTYSSSSACMNACRNAGGKSYEYNPSTKNCFCK